VESQGKGRPPGRKMVLTGKLPSEINVTAAHLPRCSPVCCEDKKMPA
jgi:hypothetical protein